jgi:hypothetical protein
VARPRRTLKLRMPRSSRSASAPPPAMWRCTPTAYTAHRGGSRLLARSKQAHSCSALVSPRLASIVECGLTLLPLHRVLTLSVSPIDVPHPARFPLGVLPLEHAHAERSRERTRGPAARAAGCCGSCSSR